jgi:hypothetical protein
MRAPWARRASGPRPARAASAIVGCVGVIAALAIAAAANAIGNGTPDGDGHPNVGMLAIADIEDEEKKYALCSGAYAGEHKSDPGQGVFLTAGHCVAWLADEEIPAEALWVTFDTTATWDEETGEAIGATTWYQAADHAIDPDFGQSPSNLEDYGILVLDTTVPVPPVHLPAEGLLDSMAAQGGLRPEALFDNVGYGVVPEFKQGPPRGRAPEGRMFSTSTFQALTKAELKLLMNSDTRGGENGGVCFGDSGSPHFVHGTNTAVAVTSGGDPLCRARNDNQRLDTGDARAFLGRYLELP